MEHITLIVVVTVAAALIFDVINGFHDAANSIATLVSTRVLAPRYAIIWAAFFNFFAIFIFTPKVAGTISKIVEINPADPAFTYVVLAGLMGAIVWDLVTWWWGIPTSSSHALIGGLAGAGLAYQGPAIINWEKLYTASAFIPLAPLMGLGIGVVLMVIAYWFVKTWHPKKVDKFFKRGQLVTAALYSIGHGGNDAQKTMGVIVAILIAGNVLDKNASIHLNDPNTSWIVWSCNIAMGLGTAMGGRKIIRTMGSKLSKLTPIHGFCSSASGAVTLFVATNFGIPVSTTHTIAGSIVGVGLTTNAKGIRWKVAFRIIAAWVITIPASAATAAVCFKLCKLIFL